MLVFDFLGSVPSFSLIQVRVRDGDIYGEARFLSLRVRNRVSEIQILRRFNYLPAASAA